jgi:murein DD-endopeptidase MepM/ murein hydrolase activator NlpD
VNGKIALSRPKALVFGVLGLVVVGLTFGAKMASAHTYTVRDGDTLSQVAEKLGVPVQRLAAANGLDDPNLVLAGSVLKVPTATGSATAEYIVRPGDTLWAISDATGVPISQLAAANGLDDPDWVPAGRVLKVPKGGSPSSSGGGQASPAAAPVIGQGGRHTVAQGETLSDIAMKTGVPAGRLAAVNSIKDPNFLAVGQVLTIPAAWDCPVPGATFVNDFAYVRPDGGRHEGVDLFAPKGTPIFAPVSGTIERYPNPSGGEAVRLYGRDGNRYYFAHLERYGEGGTVGRGTVIGYVGNTGDARATSPHLHFEIRPGGGTAVSPYPPLVAAC